MIQSQLIQIWCDVGGTFTDCIAAIPGAPLRSLKVLSHGTVQGAANTISEDRKSFSVLARQGDPDHFWDGATVRCIVSGSNESILSKCDRFENGTFHCTEPIPIHTATIEFDLGLEAPILATRLLLGIPPSLPLPRLEVRLGTTRGTNALLTRNGARTAFVTTTGFRDLLEIGYQERPDLFALTIEKRKPLYEQVAEVRERLDATGAILVPLDERECENVLNQLYREGFDSLAVCLIHAYQNPVHERTIARIARQIGFRHVSLSHEVAPMIKAVSRGETTVVDAYLTPIVKQYLQRVKHQIDPTGNSSLLVMTSAGGLVSAEDYKGKDSVLSGPAGGVVALQAIAKASALSPLIGLDMGGTSTDVCRVDEDIELEFETIKAGVRMMSPTLKIHTVAAGGGSICWFDGVQLRVGPQSAGSNPGPACYGRGGPLTITDLNLLARRIDPTTFPFPLDRDAAENKLQQLLSQMDPEIRQSKTLDEWIAGFRQLANEHMANAVRSVSVAQGADPRKHVLVAFGGAAGQHICEIAEILGMDRILDPPKAGLLSALGMGMAKLQKTISIPIYKALRELESNWLESRIDQLNAQFYDTVDSNDQWQSSFRVDARYQGTEGTLFIEVPELTLHNDLLEASFHHKHQNRFGYDRKGKPIEITLIHGLYRTLPQNELPKAIPPKKGVLGTVIDPIEGKIDRDEMRIGIYYRGPFLIVSPGSTTYVDKGWLAYCMEDRTLLLDRNAFNSNNEFHHSGAERNSVASDIENQPDPVFREILEKRIMAIAQQMGSVLEQTAMSVNVKDRRDFSCAVFNSSGDLIANAPHVPVHLGAMSATVKHFIQSISKWNRGDSFITNDPYRGGSHLPDVTVVSPVFAPDPTSDQRLNPSDSLTMDRVSFFVACRAHHAEIGGIAPGSMAPTSTNLSEEGVLIPPMKLTDRGKSCLPDVEMLLKNSKWPTRSLAENVADIAAQQAANQYGVNALIDLAQHFGTDVLHRYMEHIQCASMQKAERWIRSLDNKKYTAIDSMDDGTPVQVTITKVDTGLQESDKQVSKLRIDFHGTGKESEGNLNANPAIVSAAVLYTLRCAIADDIPLNSGVMRCVELVVPPGILDPQKRACANGWIGEESELWPAVAGGNVETSQRVVDCLFRALGLAACSQGTMNNFLFGNNSFGYYETIGGGSGATQHGNGSDAIHTHMTNTRLTDVEVLEKKYPVRLIDFSIRRDSGGKGIHHGGNGLIRQVQALTPLTVSLITSRRTIQGPPGMEEGAHGAMGENWHIERDGTRNRLPSSAQLSIQAGDSIRILTPGGGGYGRPQ